MAEKGWVGWPQDDDHEALRSKWADLDTLEEHNALARKMRQICWNYVPAVLLAQCVTPISRGKTQAGLIGVRRGSG